MDKQKQAMRNQREDAVLNRVLIWFGAAVVAEFLLLLLNRYYVNYKTSEIELASGINVTLPYLAIAGLVGAVVCAFWWYSQHKQGKKATLAAILFLVLGALGIACGVARLFQGSGVQLLCALVPATAVMALIYYLYQKEFFVVAVLSAVGILGLWIIRRAGVGHELVTYGYAVVAAVILVCVVLFGRKLQAAEGKMKLGGKEIQVFPQGASYGLIYLTCGIVAVALAAALFFGITVAYYLILAMVAWVFIMAVYYTVKLM